MSNYREPGEHGKPSPNALMLGAMLRAGGAHKAQALALLQAALARCEGNRTRAARDLGVSWRALLRWLAIYT